MHTVSVRTVAQEMAAVEQSSSDASAGRKDEPPPRVRLQAPTYDGWRVWAHASPTSRKPHAARAEAVTRMRIDRVGRGWDSLGLGRIQEKGLWCDC